jgi:hypothetical protein
MKRVYLWVNILLCALPFHMYGIQYIIQDLETFVGAEKSGSIAINNQNTILGYVQVKGKEVPCIWDQNGQFRTLPSSRLFYQYPLMNNHNQFATILLEETNSWLRGKSFSKNLCILENFEVIRDLGLPNQWKIENLREWNHFSESARKDIEVIAFNDLGQIVLANSDKVNMTKSFIIWENGIFNDLDASIEKVYSLNNQGLILGRKKIERTNTKIGSDSNEKVQMLVLYDPKEDIVQEIMEDVGITYRILNDRGQVILIHKQRQKCFLWDSLTGLVELIDFVPLAFNNCNQILGFPIPKSREEVILAHLLIWKQDEWVVEPIEIGDETWKTIKIKEMINDKGYLIGDKLVGGKKHAIVLIPS